MRHDDGTAEFLIVTFKSKHNIVVTEIMDLNVILYIFIYKLINYLKY
jgi:hypothetical protein